MRNIPIILFLTLCLSLINVFYVQNFHFPIDKITENTNYLTKYIQFRLSSPDDTSFNHNFCESKLNGNKGPEYWNAYSSLIISVVPFLLGFPKYPLLYNVACMLSVNGIASYHYHYYLSWTGKQGDEISMILANYFGMWGLINMYYHKSEGRNSLNRYNTAFMYLFLVANTLLENDALFPSIFGVYVGGSLIMIYKVGKKYQMQYFHHLVISFIGASGWIIAEHFCNEYTMFGHPLWHLLFPLGFYRLLLDFDKIKCPSNSVRVRTLSNIPEDKHEV